MRRCRSILLDMWRRPVALALLSLVATTLASAQMRQSAPMGFRGGFSPCCGRVVVSGGFGFGHNPRVSVFFGSPFFFPHHFIRPVTFFAPLIIPYPVYAQPAYPQPIIIEQSGQSDIRYQQELADEVSRLRAEVESLREERDTGTARAREPQKPAAQQQRPSPATVLIFKNGHRTEVSNYAIIGQSLWILSERTAQKVPLSNLDLKATVDVNEERGTSFSIPTPHPTTPK